MRFRSDPATIRGSIAPVVSPFTADGAPDLDGLRSLIRWQLESGSHGISLGGSTGEPAAQRTGERACGSGGAGAVRGGVRVLVGGGPVDGVGGEQPRARLQRAARTDGRREPGAERRGHVPPADRVEVPGPEEHRF